MCYESAWMLATLRPWRGSGGGKLEKKHCCKRATVFKTFHNHSISAKVKAQTIKKLERKRHALALEKTPTLHIHKRYKRKV